MQIASFSYCIKSIVYYGQPIPFFAWLAIDWEGLSIIKMFDKFKQLLQFILEQKKRQNNKHCFR
jgi:hypothetical protein